MSSDRLTDGQTKSDTYQSQFLSHKRVYVLSCSDRSMLEFNTQNSHVAVWSRGMYPGLLTLQTKFVPQWGQSPNTAD